MKIRISISLAILLLNGCTYNTISQEDSINMLDTANADLSFIAEEILSTDLYSIVRKDVKKYPFGILFSFFEEDITYIFYSKNDKSLELSLDDKYLNEETNYWQRLKEKSIINKELDNYSKEINMDFVKLLEICSVISKHKIFRLINYQNSNVSKIDITFDQGLLFIKDINLFYSDSKMHWNHLKDKWYFYMNI